MRAFCDGVLKWGCKCLIWICFYATSKTVSSSVEIGSVFSPKSKAKITTDCVEEPPLPVHVRLKVLFPAALKGTVSVPEVDFDPSHAPEAEHEFELDDDQVIVIESPVDPEVISDDIDTDGGGVVGGVE